MSVLQELMGEQPAEFFLREHFCQQPFALPYAAEKFKDLISWNLLDEIFQSNYKDCWFAKEGKLPKDPNLNRGHVTTSQAQTAFQDGHTVLIRHAEKAHVKLAEIALNFYSQFKKPIDIQLYITPKGEEGFDWHYDVEEVFVIQSQGEKEFRLLPNTVTPRPLPMISKKNCLFHQEKKASEIRCWLKAGDWLYIPAGYWHKAKALTDSFHLSVGVLSQNVRCE
jgi:50S ribosomal protein L16 3-hydroxylase